MTGPLVCECLCGWERRFDGVSAQALAPVVARSHLDGQSPVDHVLGWVWLTPRRRQEGAR